MEITSKGMIVKRNSQSEKITNITIYFTNDKKTIPRRVFIEAF